MTVSPVSWSVAASGSPIAVSVAVFSATFSVTGSAVPSLLSSGNFGAVFASVVADTAAVHPLDPALLVARTW